MEHNCSLTSGSSWFRYRAAAIIVEDGCVLFAGNAKETYYYSIGGAVHMNETAEEAVKREVFEETGINYEVDRLAVIHENFFPGESGLDGLDCHEIAFYFLMKPRGTQQLCSESFTQGVREEMHWLPVEELHKYRAYPAFMYDVLTNPSEGIIHIVTDERKN